MIHYKYECWAAIGIGRVLTTTDPFHTQQHVERFHQQHVPTAMTAGRSRPIAITTPTVYHRQQQQRQQHRLAAAAAKACSSIYHSHSSNNQKPLLSKL
jgi:hypothetical protein